MSVVRGQTVDQRTERPVPGTPCWVSLMADDPVASQEFYGRLFGWEFRPGPEQLGPYARALLDGRVVAGIGRMPEGQSLPVAWTPYLAADDVDETAGTVRHCGGTVGVGPLDAEEAGRMALAADPSGATFGIWQGREHRGAAVEGVPGSVLWNELVTRETAGVLPFYRAAFGFEAEREEEAEDAATLLLGGRPVASVLGVGQALGELGAAHWHTHFAVEDPDETVNRVIELGGRVQRPPRDGSHGRTATVADPWGAVFTVARPDTRA
ncbi:VOC family protein [Streptomyces albidoflavus]|uniref:VOC family protein n=2 Tax=Streptomyces TaxID=1883 RepID=UPI000CD52867|nr:VOC family protein [Streptomyces albidoflavus]WJK66013.1 VOC family protein [Streptomyces albidoflavus]